MTASTVYGVRSHGHEASKLSAASHRRVRAALCYAKIAPASLHCGDCAHLARKARRPTGPDRISRRTSPLAHLEALQTGAACLIFDLELLDLGRLLQGCRDPLDHLRHVHDGVG